MSEKSRFLCHVAMGRVQGQVFAISINEDKSYEVNTLLGL